MRLTIGLVLFVLAAVAVAVYLGPPGPRPPEFVYYAPIPDGPFFGVFPRQYFATRAECDEAHALWPDKLGECEERTLAEVCANKPPVSIGRDICREAGEAR